MVFQSYGESRCSLIENVAKVYTLRVEGDGIDRENTKERELDRQHLVCASYFDWNAHSELFVLVLGWFFVLLN